MLMPHNPLTRLSRRRLLQTAAVSVAGWPFLASTAQSVPVALVEVFNFRCARCRAVSDWSDRIKAAAEASGVVYRPAPIAWSARELWPDKVYYATRDLFPAAAPVIREALFNGVHDYGQTFEELAQILAYLENNQYDVKATKADPKFNLVAVADRAGTDDVLYPIAKVIRLLELANAQEVPVFLWVKGGAIVKVVSPSDASDPATLSRRVIAELSSKN